MLTEFHEIYGYNQNKELVNRFINKRIEEKCYMVNDFLQWKLINEVSNQIENKILEYFKKTFCNKMF